MRFTVLPTVLALTFAFAASAAADWPQWRGPDFNGSTDAEQLPSSWTASRGVQWRVDLPGPAASTPVVHGERIYLTSTDGDTDKLLAMCLRRKDGEVIWQHTVDRQRSLDKRATLAGPSPVTDGKIVAFYFGNGKLFVYDVDGKALWNTDITDGKGFAFQWTYSASPLLLDGRLYVQVLQRDKPVRGRGPRSGQAFLVAFDAATGKEIFKHIRDTKAIRESREAYSTPIPFRHDDRTQILVLGGDMLTAHDPADGKELWRWDGYNPKRRDARRLVPSPLVAGRQIIVCGPRNETVWAVRPTGRNLAGGDIAWTIDDRDISSDTATPLYDMGNVYLLNGEKQLLTRLDPATGDRRWNVKLGDALLRASPTGADGKIYCMNHNGDVFVIDASSGELLSTNTPPRKSTQARSSVVVSDNALFIRDDHSLTCVSK